MLESRRIADLVGHPVEIALSCRCTNVRIAKPEYLLSVLSADAALGDIGRRMRCPRCEQRATWRIALEWAVAGGRDRRPEPPPLPEWIREAIEGGDAGPDA